MADLKTAGWLSPDGTIFECDIYEHISVATKLVDKLGYPTLDPVSLGIISADENLLDHGWCHITISIWPRRERRIFWNRFLTECQKRFLRPYFEESDLPVDEIDYDRWRYESHG